MKWFFKLSSKIQKRLLTYAVILFLFATLLLSIVDFNIVTTLLFIATLALLVYFTIATYLSEKKRKTAIPTVSPSTSFVNDSFESICYDLTATDGRNGRYSRQTISRRIYWKDSPFHFPHPIIVSLIETNTTYDVTVNGNKIGEILEEDVEEIRQKYNRIFQLQIKVEHDKYDPESGYIPKLTVEYYSETYIKQHPKYQYTPAGLRVSKFLSPSFLDEYVVIDLETTGLDVHSNDIVEAAALHIKNGEVIARFSELCYSDRLTDSATQINHITAAMLRSAREPEEVIEDFVKFIGNIPIIGHNVAFDLSFISALHPISNQFDDTCILAHEFFTGEETKTIHIPNCKLPTVCAALEVSHQPTHRALSDCLAVFKCYEKMKTIIPALMT